MAGPQSVSVTSLVAPAATLANHAADLFDERPADLVVVAAERHRPADDDGAGIHGMDHRHGSDPQIEPGFDNQFPRELVPLLRFFHQHEGRERFAIFDPTLERAVPAGR